jgi:predicted Rossmann fold flavoprotein
MLMEECRKANVEIQTGVSITKIEKQNSFNLVTDTSRLVTSSLVIATGGLSIPKMGASNFGLKIADQFGINNITPRPGLVPLTFHSMDFEGFKDLSGISIDAEVRCNKISFREKMLLTHRGLSGPSILQISSCWNPGDLIVVNLLPGIDFLSVLNENHQSKKQLATILEQFLPARFVKVWLVQYGGSKPLNQYSSSELKELSRHLSDWQIMPSGTEGFAKAEVTVGGIDTDELSSKTMEAKKEPGLYFIGEVVDVTGWLGGYNFQWAWSSGWAAGQVA